MSDKEKEKLKRKAAKRAQKRKEGSEGTSDETSSSKRKKSKLPATILGAKYVRLLDKAISSLRSEVAHGNRKLFLDDVFVVYLLAFFNPIVRSLRTLEDLSKTRQAQKHLSVSAVCKSTLSDFNKIVEPRGYIRFSLHCERLFNMRCPASHTKTKTWSRCLSK